MVIIRSHPAYSMQSTPVSMDYPNPPRTPWFLVCLNRQRQEDETKEKLKQIVRAPCRCQWKSPAFIFRGTAQIAKKKKKRGIKNSYHTILRAQNKVWQRIETLLRKKVLQGWACARPGVCACAVYTVSVGAGRPSHKRWGVLWPNGRGRSTRIEARLGHRRRMWRRS
jgi:hypothetical protein